MSMFIFMVGVASIAVAQTSKPLTQPTTTPFQVGHIDDPGIPESSGIVQSRRFPSVFWTHNDGGNPPMIFAIDRAGKTIQSYKVRARNIDWEDIAIDDAGQLYIGEIGNNGGRNKQITVHRIDEPDPRAGVAGTAAAAPQDLPVTQTWNLRFPDQPFDCESLFVWKDDGYVVSKHRDGRPAGLHRFGLEAQTRPAVLEKVCDLPIRFPVTGADIAPDGSRIAVISVAGPYLFDLPAPGVVASIARSTPRSIFYTDVRMEAVCFTSDGLLATTENRPILLFRWADFGKK